MWPTYTGSGIIVAVVDDGLDGGHLELAPNYVIALLLCFNYYQLITMEKLMFALIKVHAFAALVRLSVVAQVTQSPNTRMIIGIVA